MVKVFTSHHTYTHTWEDVTYGLLRKYPNPLSSHVLACDTIARRVDPQTGTLVSQRLLKKTNNKVCDVLRMISFEMACFVAVRWT
jgi:hypothetical protein